MMPFREGWRQSVGKGRRRHEGGAIQSFSLTAGRVESFHLCIGFVL